MAEGTMHFERFGRTYHLRIRTADDLRSVLELNDALWIATSAPLATLNTNAEFLRLVDTDGNGQIRCDELRAAIRWLLARLADTSRLAEGTDELSPDMLRREEEQSQQLAGTMRYLLEAVGAPDRQTVRLRDIEAFERSLDQQPINGDGVIPPEAADEPDLRQFLADALACTGGTEDRIGRAGITEEQLDRFMQQAAQHVAWLARADEKSSEREAIMPLGEETPDAYAALEAVRGKVEDFFARCQALCFLGSCDMRQGAPDETSAEAARSALARAPLAEPGPDCRLPLADGVNPLYAEALDEFCRRVVVPVLGEREELTEDDWQAIVEFFSGHAAWLSEKPEGAVGQLGRGRLETYLAGDHAERARELLEDDRRAAEQAARARELKKLLLYHKHLMQLVNNFVSFPDLYDPQSRALFEMGSLVMDGRWFNFAVRVENLEEHRQVARTSRMYVLYLSVTRVDESDRFIVACPATSGTVGNLCVGKRGIFYDTAGRHYGARVVEIIENPISFREALLSPFVRLGRFIAGKIESMSSGAQRALESRLARTTEQVEEGVVQTVEQGPQAAQPQQQSAAQASASRRDLLVGASVSIAALSSAFAFITKTLSGLGYQQILLALLIVVGVVMLPTAIVAAFKLRRRDLSALLEGCGWAINARMRLNREQRKQFTRHEPYPPGATGTPRRRWLLLVLVLVLLAVAGWAVVRALRSEPHGSRRPVPPAAEQPVPIIPKPETGPPPSG
ncbi:MAG: hypothetical protein R6V05_02575 [Candidatus Brocadiia bacterium]